MAPSGLYARLCHAFLVFFNDFSETNYLKIRWTDFAIFTLNESFLAVDDRSGPLFRYLKGRCHGKRFCAKNGKLPIFVALVFRNGMR